MVSTQFPSLWSQVMVRALLLHELTAFQTVRKPLALQLATCHNTARLLSNFLCIKWYVLENLKLKLDGFLTWSEYDDGVTLNWWKLCLNFQMFEAALENMLAACSIVYYRWTCSLPLLAIKQNRIAGVWECYILHLPLANLHFCSICHIHNLEGRGKCLPQYFFYLRIVFFWLLSCSGANKQNWEAGERVEERGVYIYIKD